MLTAILLLAACDGAPDTTPTEATPASASSEAPAEHDASGHDHNAAAPAAQADGWSHYGAPFSLTEVRTATEVLGSPEQFVDQGSLGVTAIALDCMLLAGAFADLRQVSLHFPGL